jgi:hypothetical protein
MKNLGLHWLNKIWVCIELPEMGYDLALDETENIVNQVMVQLPVEVTKGRTFSSMRVVLLKVSGETLDHFLDLVFEE